LTEDSQTDCFSQGSPVESNYYMVLHPPVELARVTGHLDFGAIHFSDYGVNEDWGAII
jgi:hypothetical protein